MSRGQVGEIQFTYSPNRCQEPYSSVALPALLYEGNQVSNPLSCYNYRKNLLYHCWLIS